MKPLVIIPARDGSKGLPGKNIKLLNGKPLINYTVEAAREVFSDEHICVSTDSHEIKEKVEQTGLPVQFLRPKHLSTDTAGSREVILHALEFYKGTGYNADTLILLQPTSPLRNAMHINEALNLWKPDLDMVVSVKKTDSNPYYVLFEENSKGFLEKSKKGSFTRRQDCPTVYEINGAIYIISAESLLKKEVDSFDRIIKYVMSKRESIDIDDEIDLKLASLLI